MVYQDIRIPLPAFIAIDWTLMTITGIPIALRLYLRRRHPTTSRALTVSDAFVLFSYASGLILISINAWKNSLRYAHIHDPPGTLSYMVPPSLTPHLLHLSYASLFFIYTSLWSTKAAFLALYYHLFALTGGRRTQLGLHLASAFTASTFLLHLLLLLLWCRPLASNWDPTARADGELCSAVHSIDSVSISTAANIATDLVILTIPLSALWRMRLGRRERGALAFVFLMGGLSIVAAATRWVCLWLVRHVPRPNITHTIDVWALVEIVSGLLAVCLPSLRAFVRGKKAEGVGVPREHGPTARRAWGSLGSGAFADDGGAAAAEPLHDVEVGVLEPLADRDSGAGDVEKERIVERRKSDEVGIL